MAEAIGGIAAIVLTILGLAHISPILLVAIATIAVGLALLAQGWMLASDYIRLVTARGEVVIMAGASSVWSIELLAGAAGIVLGILALLQIVPPVLVAIAVITYGGGLVLSSGAMTHMSVARITEVDERVRRLMAEAASGSAVVQAMIGLAAIVLGILSLSGFVAVDLILIALLATGVHFVVNGSTFGSLMISVFRT